MNNKLFVRLIFCLGLIMPGCSKEQSVPEELVVDEPETTTTFGKGAQQVDGIGFFDETPECIYGVPGLDQPAYAVKMTGDLTGCLFIFVDSYKCSPSGTYREVGREFFRGTYKGQSGTFWTTYKFEAKYEGCNPDGSYEGLEIFGRCQHPIVDGSGTGVFAGVTGRLDMKDDIANANYPYRGHFKF